MESILIIDDNKDTRDNIAELMEINGYQTFTAGDGNAAVYEVRRLNPDCLILDMKLPGLHGKDVLKQIQPEIEAGLVVINITAFGEIAAAVEAIRLGAYDFIEKPFNNDVLLLSVHRGLNNQKIRRELNNLRRILGRLPEAEKIFGKSEAIQKMVSQIEIVAPTNMTALIQGETGAGKEVVAHYLHSRSARNKAPFVAIDCGAIPETLVESELFGHHRGAFTDAKESRTGRFEMASGGTLFLDEIGNLPLLQQRKLLRAVEQRKITPVGSEKEIDIDVRLIVASNEHLDRLVKVGKFREDLFFRLSEFTIYVPPLRERIADIPYLAITFVEEANQDTKSNILSISDKALKKLTGHSWPGNVRELRNVIRKAALMADKTLRAEHIIFQTYSTFNKYVDELVRLPFEENQSPKEYLDAVIFQLEKKMIERVLALSNGNLSKAAKSLDIARKTLYQKLDQFGIVVSEPD